MLILGTVAFDSVETPFGSADRVLGGSATFAAYAASTLTAPRLVGVVGHDFPDAVRAEWAGRGICLAGLQTAARVRTQFWRGRYHANLHDRDHLEVDLDVFDHFEARVPEAYRDSEFVLLAHTDPVFQHRVLDQLRGPRFVMADTIDHWIQTKPDELRRLLTRIDGLFVNEGEARLLTGETNLFRAARRLRELGPGVVVIKKGEHGALLATADGPAVLPAYPTGGVTDPTGAGDTFAGGFVGQLAAGGEITPPALRRATARGMILASLTVEGFGPDRLARATPAEIDARLGEYRAMLTF